MNKKVIVIAVSFVLLTLTASAQLGVQVGYNFAKVSGIDDGGFEEKSLNSLAGGIFFEKDVIPLIDLRIGVLYSPKGYHYAYGDEFYTKMYLNYVEVPLQAKVKVGPLYALGGFYAAYAVDGSQKSRLELTPGFVVTSDEKIDFEDAEINRFDFGAKLGAGVQFGVGPVNVFAQGEYLLGLQNLSTNDDADPMKNRVFGVSAGVIINIF